MFSRIGGRALKADLGKTIAICEYLGHPERKFKSIHIAGTNGKGSVTHMMAAVFQENGYKTALFTSPHLRDFRERIKINGQMVPQEFVVDFVQKIKDFAENLKPSFFELTFGMAMDYFASQRVDVAAIETGLGGRLDSTNVILPELSIITNIGYDHMDILGDTLEKIAGEKAGIVKEGIPVIIGETHSETSPVFIRTAENRHSPIYFADQLFSVVNSEVKDGYLFLTIRDNGSGKEEIFQLDLIADYQKKNVLSVVKAVDILGVKFTLSADAVKRALTKVAELTNLEGRWQVLGQHPYIVMDVGHNSDGIGQLIKQLSHMRFDRLHIVTGMVKDKDINAVLNLYPKEALYYFTNAHITRALPAGQLKVKAEEKGLHGKDYDDVNEAVLSAFRNSSENDLILICGSVFVVGEVDVRLVKTLKK